jgi:hypothetical protein
MDYEVLSPWAEVDPVEVKPLQPRLKDLNGKTIGLYAHFKDQAVIVQQEVETQLKQKYPRAQFKYFQYVVDTAEVINDTRYRASFEAWFNGIDAVVSAWGDMGSCTMYLAYNTADMEKLGKPAVLLLGETFINQAKRGAVARGIPSLRLVKIGITPQDQPDTIRPAVTAILDDIIDGLTAPLTKAEKSVPDQVKKQTSRIVFKGDISEVNNYFYQKGWTNGVPIIPPTEAAVKEMLTGTDLPADFVVAKLPPMDGKATVEKIAINAVMAGCLPTYMPVLIAAVKGMVDPKIHLEGWTCSAGSWEPVIIVSGKIGRDLNFNTGRALMSPYYKPASTIARAFALIIMNISGVRPGLEDASNLGHENRFGICFAEDNINSPWPPIHTEYGIDKDDSAVTLTWPATSYGGRRKGGPGVAGILSNMCDVPAVGFFPGVTHIIGIEIANALAKENWTRRSVINYIVEYARQPASQTNISWLVHNHHYPKIIQEGKLSLPVDPEHSTRIFFDDEHIAIVVAGHWDMGSHAFIGGGDHGGPSCTKIELPENWNALVEKYKDIVPTYEGY